MDGPDADEHGRRDDPLRFSLLPEKLVLDTARETVTLFHQYWPTERANLPLSRPVVEAIEAHLKRVPIA